MFKTDLKLIIMLYYIAKSSPRPAATTLGKGSITIANIPPCDEVVEYYTTLNDVDTIL